eukprot:gnl/TRDRNA2_/TRDRNA2_87601_c0_seq1.p1 gnl/TRDRNA2_/TRDRNA2_87601_c0~~gnl/TRDRNA2_/TRDRNA2_87601_c0_seq1.p1  ORF type:complete len:183 (-),score=36.87 gnl/TRDRNA2_/TRDRNA2_87601_c0_seq1:469-1017(-)
MGCQSSSQALGQAPKEIEQQKYKVKDEHYPGGTRDVPKLEGSLEKSALWERSRGSKELGLEASQLSSTSTTSTTDSDPCELFSGNTSLVSDISSVKAEGTQGNTLEERHPEPQPTPLEIGRQNDQENFRLETPKRMNMTAFLRMVKTMYAEAADDVIISDIVAREEPYAIIIPTFQKAEYHS